MGRKIKYRFGGISFTAKSAVKEHVSKLLKKYFERGDIPSDSDDYLFVSDLLKNHIDYKQKVGCGVTAFFVDRSPSHPTNSFFLRRSDGKEVHFGRDACLDTNFQLNKASLRELVRPQIKRFKEIKLGNKESFISEYSKKVFSSHEAHVDHYDPTFDDIVINFFQDRSENPQGEMLTESIDGSSMPKWKSEEMALAFCEYHQNRAKLILVHERENLSDLRKIQNARKM